MRFQQDNGNAAMSRTKSSAQQHQRSSGISGRPFSHHQAMVSPLRLNHHIQQQNHPAAPHLTELANYNNGNNKRHIQQSSSRNSSNVILSPASAMASAAVAQSHLARVNASVSSVSSSQRKVSDSVVLNGAMNNSRPEVNK